jgi:carbon monoxide dehydrogenase subunit G
MQVKITKTFQIQEPVARVWEFLKDPRKVAACVPGSQITEALDDRRYAGTITVKVGPVVSDYKGELSIERLDAPNYEIELLGKGRDVKGKGSASMRMVGKLRPLPDGGTEVTGTSEISIVGVLAQFGSRMVEEVSSQMFSEFTGALQKNLQTAGDPATAETPAPSLSILPLLATAIKRILQKFFRRFTGRRVEPL